MRLKRHLAGLFLTIIVSGLVRAGQPPIDEALHLRLIRDGGRRFHVDAEVIVPVSEKVVWDTVRDYDHMSEFIPMLIVSQRTSYLGRPAVRQVGRAKWMMLHFEAKTILEETFNPEGRTLELHALEGDFSRFDSVWHLTPLGAGQTAIRLRSEAILKRWAPQWLERRLARRAVYQSLNALIAEMKRRGKTQANL